jgi:hypothetical protein
MIREVFLLGAVMMCCLQAVAAQPATKAGTIPILYTSDLYHPHDDPDDHFDLATLFAIAEFDIRAIVIDTGRRGAERPGLLPIRQMMYITGRTVPHSTGLTANLGTQGDKGDRQPAAAQAGVELLLRQIRESRTSVTIFTAGSLRDVAAAYNRNPALFREKVARLYINAGHSSGGKEWNVDLDRYAYVRIMTSELSVYWVPCFGADGYQSKWSFRQGDVLDSVSLQRQNYFVYALTKASPKERDPIETLTEPIPDAVRKKIWAEQRNMWCTAAFLHAAGRSDPTFTFKKVAVQIDDQGVTRIDPKGKGPQIFAFHCDDAAAYENAMRKTLRGLLAGIKPVRN